MTHDAAELQRLFTNASLGMTAYRSWAQQARRERYFNIARLFDALSAAKLARAEQAFRNLGETGTTSRNIDRALSGMEPEAIAAGSLTGNNPVARDLLERAKQALGERRDLRASEIGDMFVCPRCGNLQEGANATTCPSCGTVAEAHRSFRAIEAMGTLGPNGIMRFLEQSHTAIRTLVREIDENLLEQRLIDDEPSFKEVVGHLADIDAVFRERAWLILETSRPQLSSAHPPTLHAAMVYRTQPLDQILELYHRSRKQTLSLMRGLTSAAWHREGQHELYGVINLLHQGNWFVSHERAHLVELAQLRHDLLNQNPDAAELSEPLVNEVVEGE